MKTRNYIIAPIVMLAILAVFSVPAMAQDCWQNVEASPYGTNGTINGDVYVGGGEYSEDAYQEFDVPLGNIIWAKAYWHGWMPGTSVTATFCNATDGCTQNTVNRCDNSDYKGFLHGGCGSAWMWWNVTDIVTNGYNNISAVADSRWQVLVVVLEDGSDPEINYSVNQGYLDDWDYTTHFYGPANNTRNGTVWQLAFTWNGPGDIWFNNGTTSLEYLLDNTPEGGYGVLEEYDIPPENTSASDNTMRWYIYGDEYVHPCLAVYKDNIIEAELGKDLIVEDIEFPTVMRPNKNQTINATIKNQGDAGTGQSFNVSLYINDDLNETISVSALGAGESTPVSFQHVNESEGCYTFKVVADVYNQVQETNEDNNATSEKYQVGYVIVVESDSDFEKLNETGNAALPTNCFKNESGTYYIQNLTIENCAGDGVIIKNTNAKFVINNCTVRNCTPHASGVFLHNLSNGTINGSTIQNNTDYGIELGLVPLSAEDPKFVNITNNTITENKLNGIDLIGFNCTVKDNNVTNNSVYGIYVLANDSEIYNNTIKYNDGYGVKLYNSTGNYVYENKFTNNNLDYPTRKSQAWDNWNNYWNNTKGNWWSDWRDNSGYSNGTYEIDGGDNEDEKPTGPLSTYDFSTGVGDDKWAFKKQVNNINPDTNDVPSTNLSETEYDNIKANDGTPYAVATSDTSGYYAAHRFNFTIAENVSKITKINVTWNGIGKHDFAPYLDGAKLYIWNFSSGDSGAYDELADSGNTAAEVTLTGERTEASNYIDSSSNMTVLVVQKSPYRSQGNKASHIETDYVRVVITL